MRTVATALVMLAVVGCGGGTKTPSSSGSTSGSSGSSGSTGTSGGGCTETLSGAETATVSNCQAVGGWNASTSKSAITLSGGTFPATISQLTVGVRVSGQLVAGTYSSTDANADGSVQVVATSGTVPPTWVATAGGSNPPQGSWTVTVTSVELLSQSANSAAYTIHGSVAATLEPVPGSNATGTVSLTGSF